MRQELCRCGHGRHWHYEYHDVVGGCTNADSGPCCPCEAYTPTPAPEGETPRAALMAAIAGELDHAYAKHGRDPWGRHEFYAILLEEVEELWAEIKADAPSEKVLAELRQVAAMCFRYAETGDRYRGEHPAIPTRQVKHG